MRKGRPLSPLDLISEEREALERWVNRRKTTQALAERARIILACATGQSNLTVAADLHITPQIMEEWRPRFIPIALMVCMMSLGLGLSGR